MAAVDRAALENGVELVWLNPPVLGDQSGAVARAGVDQDSLTDASGDYRPARAIAMLQPQPEFPAKARADSIEGWVTVSYVIGRDGRVSNVDIVAAQPRNVFESAVRRAVRSWRFEPTTVDGSAVATRKTQTIRFSLSDVQPADGEECAQHGHANLPTASGVDRLPASRAVQFLNARARARVRTRPRVAIIQGMTVPYRSASSSRRWLTTLPSRPAQHPRLAAASA
jgi:TonB family protein